MKRFVSVTLALVMLICTMVYVPTTVDAYTSKTQSEAVVWINAKVGQYLDYDGSYGAQCVDLIKYYYDYLGVSAVRGNACDYATNALPSGWSRIQYYSGFVAQPGDIAVFLGPSSYGHVALVTSADTSRMYIVENNHDGSGTKPANTYSYSYTGASMKFYGVIRPDFAGSDSNIYTSITPGVYYLKNKADGQYLIVDAGVDANKQNISVWPWADCNEMKFEITATSTGYKMRPLCSSARIVNAWGTTPGDGSNVNLYDDCSESSQWWQFEEAEGGGYFIHNVFAPNCVLDTEWGRNVLITAKYGGDDQIWYLESIQHDHNKGEFMYYLKSHPHYNCYKCSVCGTIWEDRTEENIVESCTDCVEPPLPYIIDPGDVNDDGSINLTDVSLTLKHIAKWSNIMFYADVADVNDDSVVNLTDVSLLMRYIAGWNITLI